MIGVLLNFRRKLRQGMSLTTGLTFELAKINFDQTGGINWF